LTSGESSFGDLYFEAHRVGPAGVLDDELVPPVLLRVTLTEHFGPGESSLAPCSKSKVAAAKTADLADRHLRPALVTAHDEKICDYSKQLLAKIVMLFVA
jgi:hypothetical protein